MKRDNFKLSLILSAAAIALLDVAYIIFLGLQVYRVQGGIAALSGGFGGFSVAVIVANAALLCYTAFYLIFRKR